MVNFLGGPRNSHLRAMHWTASNDSGASLDADPTKILDGKKCKKQKAQMIKREEKEFPSKSANSVTGRNISHIQPNTRTAVADSVKSIVQTDTNDDQFIEAPPLRSPKAKPQISTNIQCEVIDQPLSPKSPNVVNSPERILKTVASPTGTMQREREQRFFRSKKGVHDETAISMTPEHTTTKAKTKKKGLFSRFGGRKDKDDRSTSNIASGPKEIVHEIIAKDTRRVSMSPIVVTVAGSEGDLKQEVKVDQNSSKKDTLDKSPQHQDRVEKSISNFVDTLTSFARLPTPNLSRSAKKHGSFLLEVFQSEPTGVVSSPRAASKSNTAPTIPTDLPFREAEHPRQSLSPVDPARQKQWIVSVIEAIHRARRVTTTRHDDYESMMDSEDSDILDGPRVMYSGDLDDASVSSIEVLFHWMTCNMDRVYAVPNKDHRGTVVNGDDFSQMEDDDDESTEGSLEY